MKIRLHEIELGTGNVQAQSSFFQTILGLQSNVREKGLTVFKAGLQGFDFNLSNHFPSGIAAISFLTDDLQETENRLKAGGIVYTGPSASHLGMTTVQLKNADGYVIKINTPGNDSPAWLKRLLDDEP